MKGLFRWGALLLALTLPSCGSSTPTAPTSAADVTITITGVNSTMSFNPASATVKVGQTVAWVNSDSITHAPVQDAGVFNGGDIAGGQTSAPIKMTTAGTFGYHCAIHPSMVGNLTVNP